MPSLAEHLGYAVADLPVAQGCPELPPGFIGIEIELEAGDNEGSWPAVDGWELKPDGSLRDGMEYVFDGPQSGPTALASIRAVAEAMSDFNPDPTFRCSTHIHLDVRTLDWLQYQKLVLLYMIYEDVMFDHCQPYRRSSNFCIPFMANDWLSSRFGRGIIGSPSDALRFSHLTSWPKYSALNLQTSSSFGTIEFRGQHALYTEEDLVSMAQRMLHLKRFVLEDTSPNLPMFIEAASVGCDAVFLQGLKPGYVMTEGALEVGIGSAWNAVIQASAEPEPDAALPSGWGSVPPRQNHSMLREAVERRVELNVETLARLNVEVVSPQTTYRQAMTILASLNRLNGVNVSLTQLITTRRNAGVLRFLRSEIGNINSIWGLNFTEQQLS